MTRLARTSLARPPSRRRPAEARGRGPPRRRGRGPPLRRPAARAGPPGQRRARATGTATTRLLHRQPPAQSHQRVRAELQVLRLRQEARSAAGAYTMTEARDPRARRSRDPRDPHRRRAPQPVALRRLPERDPLGEGGEAGSRASRPTPRSRSTSSAGSPSSRPSGCSSGCAQVGLDALAGRRRRGVQRARAARDLPPEDRRPALARDPRDRPPPGDPVQRNAALRPHRDARRARPAPDPAARARGSLARVLRVHSARVPARRHRARAAGRPRRSRISRPSRSRGSCSTTFRTSRATGSCSARTPRRSALNFGASDLDGTIGVRRRSRTRRCARSPVGMAEESMVQTIREAGKILRAARRAVHQSARRYDLAVA